MSECRGEGTHGVLDVYSALKQQSGEFGLTEKQRDNLRAKEKNGRKKHNVPCPNQELRLLRLKKCISIIFGQFCLLYAYAWSKTKYSSKKGLFN